MSTRLPQNLQQAWWTFIPILLVSVFLMRLATGLILFTQPKLYESIALLDELPAPPVAPGKELHLTEAKCELLITRLDLDHRWRLDRSAAADKLGEMLRIQRTEDGSATSITCRSTHAADARDIAQVAADHYRGWLHEKTLLRIKGADYIALQKLGRLRQQLKWQQQHLIDWGDVAKSNEQTARAIRIAREEAIPEGLDEALSTEVGDYVALLEQGDFLKKEIQALEDLEARLTLPKPATITILSAPVQGLEPVSPNVTLGMLWGTVAGIITGILAWWSYMARLRTPLTPEQIVEQKQGAKARNAADY